MRRRSSALSKPKEDNLKDSQVKKLGRPKKVPVETPVDEQTQDRLDMEQHAERITIDEITKKWNTVF